MFQSHSKVPRLIPLTAVLTLLLLSSPLMAQDDEEEIVLGWETSLDLSMVITEGNTAMHVVPADRLVFVVNPRVPRAAWKEDWKTLAERSSVVIVAWSRAFAR